MKIDREQGVIHTDLLIIGSGGAGIRAAIEADLLGIESLLVDKKLK